MKNSELLNSIEYIDEKMISEYAEAKPSRSRLILKLLPAVACLALIIAVIPTLTKHNAPDKRYEATHKTYASTAEATAELGDGFLFTKLGNKDVTEITLTVSEKGAFADESAWTAIEYYTKDDTEMIDMSIFLPAFSGNYPDHLRTEKQQMLIGDTLVTYCVYEKGSTMSDDHFVAAEFEYGGNKYEFLFSSVESPDNAFVYLNDMLG